MVSALLSSKLQVHDWGIHELNSQCDGGEKLRRGRSAVWWL